jgi:putative ATP-binding cassette transporter
VMAIRISNTHSILTSWQLIKAYWQSQERYRAYGIFAIVMLMTIFLVGLDLVFSYWQNYFYNALQAYDKPSIWYLITIFLFLAAVNMVFVVYRYYIAQSFGLRWRKWLTHQFVTRWLKHRAYYLIENFDQQTDNPDQRIQEDVGAIVTYSINLFIGFITSVTTLLGFIYVLWVLSGNLIVPLGSFGIWIIPGYLVWISLLYAFVGTVFTFKIGRPLVGLNFEQQRREANFRYAAVDLRSHAEHVALYRGESHQKHVLNNLFDRVLNNAYAIILRQKLLLWFTAGYNQTAIILPLVMVLPNYFDKVFLLGGLIQSVRAFGSVQDSLSFLVNSYTQIAEWRAISQRLTTFHNHMNTFEQKAAEENKLKLSEQTENHILIKDVSLKTPQDKVLLENINETFVHGQHYLIKGASGIGKSTFIRAIAGIWPFATGQIVLPSQKTIMYLPQKPYMPIGTLSEAVLFPGVCHQNAVSKLEKILTLCQLEAFLPRLQEIGTWSQELSPGEQQRVSFARILFHQPDWVFLDESTSMLDMASEQYLYNLLKTYLPKCSIISVGHRPSLEAFHDRVILFDTQ